MRLRRLLCALLILLACASDAHAQQGNFERIRLGPLGSPFILTGSGSPEAAVTAPVGSIYLRSGAAPIIWTKTSGTGNTGWTESLTPNQALNTTSAPTFASVDTGQGANELYDMDQNVLMSSAPTFATVDTGQGANELFDMDQHVLQASAVTFATVDTGQGANDLYDMNQDVLTTSAVTHTSVTTTAFLVNAVDAQSITDNAVPATPTTFTLTPAASYVELDCGDTTDGCVVTLGETSMTEGSVVTIVSVSVGTNTFADTATVSELSGTGMVAGQYDALTLRYIGDRWVEQARSDN